MSKPEGTPSGTKRVDVKIKAEEKELYGVYSTLAQINHTAEEFTFNFLYVVPNSPVGKLMSSVILSPAHAKRFLKALDDNIQKYEKQFGPIRGTVGTPDPEIGFVQ